MLRGLGRELFARPCSAVGQASTAEDILCAEGGTGFQGSASMGAAASGHGVPLLPRSLKAATIMFWFAMVFVTMTNSRNGAPVPPGAGAADGWRV